ncbi:MAG: hypothetical protein U9P50_00930 [Patescibacteria group bacterium]|nr:hypothetical protein [Patescibacteria group bacterium]
MKLKLPEKYIKYFPDDIIYLSRHPNNKLLLMNKDNYKELGERLENKGINPKSGVVRFFKAGIVKVDFDKAGGIVDIPEFLEGRLSKKERAYEDYNLGLVVS